MSKYEPYLKERKCRHCEKMFMPYQSTNGRWLKKVCKECKKKQSQENGKKGLGQKLGTYKIYELRNKLNEGQKVDS